VNKYPTHSVLYSNSDLPSPADLRGALNSISITTLDAHAAAQKKLKNKAKEPNDKKPPNKRGRKPKDKTGTEKPAKKKPEDASKDEEEAYHFIGYVPAHGKVWELDGFKSGPLEVGELTNTGSSRIQDPSPSYSRLPDTSITVPEGWMDVVRPALRMKMQKYGSIRFSLLALVDGTYERVNDEWEYWRRDRIVLERRLDEIDLNNWRTKVCLPPVKLIYVF
jgi:ubiquitin carboxyl-terminal hydrolase L5